MMRPFIVKYKNTGKSFMVLDRSPNGWCMLADAENKEIKFVKSLKGYAFVGFAK